MTRPLTSNQKGFTILELLIATMVFSVIFLGVTTAIVQMSKLYYKGVVSGRTQEANRSIVDQISQQLQFNNVTPTATVTKDYTVPGAPNSGILKVSAVCIGNTRYSYYINAQVDDVADGTFDTSGSRMRHALWRDPAPIGGCDPVDLSKINPSDPLNDGGEMLGRYMRLSEFSVNCNAANVCTVAVGIVYGDNDLIEFDTTGTDPVPVRCQSIIGSQWCASSRFTTSVVKRVGG